MGRHLVALALCLPLLVACGGDAATPPESTSSETSTTSDPSASASGTAGSGDQTIDVDGAQVATSCSGPEDSDGPTVVLLAGMPDPLTTFADLQASIAQSARVCSYDRLGEGTSSPPADQQSLADIATFLDKVLAAQGIDGDVLLVGHSLGGLVAAQFAQQYQDRTAGLLLLDATPPSMVQAILTLIPDTATDIAAAVRGEMLALSTGENPEKLVYQGEAIGSVGDVPLVAIRHGQPIFAQVPTYGEGIEQAWVSGQDTWPTLSSDGTLLVAESSGHYIYRDQPDLVLEQVTALLD
ncbi:alpha/beta fold hydrolase [Epidermidibacterium keratini]|uniref:Alpha/beta fold hydrolase n=1 Tax=Epidermidibacterium keratini TaxID=1891644 RepID=A0A7L4YTQ4_9ACTN|nr:alpha/beta hydrolase [Epidermidibacterium keratini]QHC02159.1 alpha/beta fold hydrolase [Epidermidibacterium keratini]